MIDHPMVCPFCGSPRPDGDGSNCIAYEETYDAVSGGDPVPPIWQAQVCAQDAAEDALEDDDNATS